MTTIGTFLMFSKTLPTASTDYAKLTEIKGHPDLIGKPSRLESTTCSDTQQTFESGIKEIGDMDFTANYHWDEYESLTANENTPLYLSVWFGEDPEMGTDGKLVPNHDGGKFDFQGQYVLGVAGKGVNEIRETSISFYPTTSVTPDFT